MHIDHQNHSKEKHQQAIGKNENQTHITQFDHNPCYMFFQLDIKINSNLIRFKSFVTKHCVLFGIIFVVLLWFVKKFGLQI